MPEILHDVELINDLEKEHEILIELFLSSLKDGYEQGNLEISCEKLTKFKQLFQNHLAKENVQLFSYLEQSVKWHPTSLKRVRKFRKELNENSKTIIQFCKKYSRPIDIVVVQKSFEDEFKRTCKELIQRIQLVEAKMYTLYDAN